MFKAMSLEDLKRAQAPNGGEQPEGRSRAKEAIGSVKSWEELEAALDSLGGLEGSRRYSAAELKSQLAGVRALNLEGAMGDSAPIFNSLTREGGFRDKARELTAMDNARKKIENQA